MNKTAEAPAQPAQNYEIKALWSEYEKIAMHFNDLLIRLRIQSLGGIAAVGAVATVLLKETGDPAKLFGYLAILDFALLAAWIALAVLDLTYYDRMLIGAVTAIQTLENASSKSAYVNEISLSTEIMRAVRQSGGSLTSESWLTGRKAYYLIVGLTLLLLGVGLYCKAHSILPAIFV